MLGREVRLRPSWRRRIGNGGKTGNTPVIVEREERGDTGQHLGWQDRHKWQKWFRHKWQKWFTSASLCTAGTSWSLKRPGSRPALHREKIGDHSHNGLQDLADLMLTKVP